MISGESPEVKVDCPAAWYAHAPTVVALDDALASVGLRFRDVSAVVLSHLHFDHCGQQRLLGCPVFVQAVEHREVQRPRYTIPEWAAISGARLRLVDGDATIADGVHLIATPGHRPGHQSVLVQAGEHRGDELRTGEPAQSNLHDDAWRDAARASLNRIRVLRPDAVQLSHDPDIVQLAEM